MTMESLSVTMAYIHLQLEPCLNNSWSHKKVRLAASDACN